MRTTKSCWPHVPQSSSLNTLRPRQNGRHFPDDIFKCNFLNENVWILIKISLNFVPKGPINNISALVQIMAWRRPGDKPLSEPMMVSLLTHICVTRPQWVKHSIFGVNHRSDPSQKSHNASGKYPSMHHFVTELCTFVHISVTKWCIVWYGAGALWDSSNRFIVTPFFPWRRHQMKTSSTLLAICVGNSPGTGECPTQRPVTQNFDVFCDLCLNKWLSKQWWGWWFGTPSLSLWCHCNA